MSRLSVLASSAVMFALLGCDTSLQPSSTTANPAMGTADFADQSRLVKLVLETGIAEPDRSLVHLSHICNLTIDQQTYAAIDMRELVKGAIVPRGVNQIIVLNPGQQLLQRIEYGQSHPLFCEKNKLYLYDNITLDGSTEEGNVLTFTDSGFKVTLSQEDLNQRLPLAK
ncbi:MAG TPA: hypothetical protein VN030_10410 [Cellvibrio sp.]|nr:hypothetical protein [Cellvibrio sp.]